MNRAQRRAAMFTVRDPSPNGYRRAFHKLDDDACCIHCGFDAAEEWHLRHSVPREAREPKPDWAIYCSRQPKVKL